MKKARCLIVDDEPIAREIIKSYISKISNLELIKECKNVAEAIAVLNDDSIDLLFLDINMPEISGLTLAKTINSKTKIIFTTAYREYALEGFEAEAIDYLLKPISFDRFFKAVQKFFNLNQFKTVMSNENEKEIDDFIFVRSERKMVKIKFDEIAYIESLGDYVKMHMKDNIVTTRETIQNIESQLPEKSFLRTHRSFIVAVDCITSFTNEFVELSKKAIPISRTYKIKVLERLVSKKG